MLAKVTSDEADAGFVYRTDAVAAADEVERLAIPEARGRADDVPDRGRCSSRASPGLAGQFVDLVRSGQGRQVLADAGFGRP